MEEEKEVRPHLRYTPEEIKRIVEEEVEGTVKEYGGVPKGWIGFDLDGTLAIYDDWNSIDHIGEPMPLTVALAAEYLKQGFRLKIMTARYAGVGVLDLFTGKKLTEEDISGPIQAWCKKHIGEELPVTNKKDFQMIKLYDDRAVSVKRNDGALKHWDEPLPAHLLEKPDK